MHTIHFLTRFILFISFFQFSSCINTELTNACDTTNKNFNLTLALRWILDDRSNFCGYRVERPICDLPYWEVSKPENWKRLQTYLLEKSKQNEGGVKNIYTIPIPDQGFSVKNFYTAGLIPNGKIIALPSNEQSGILLVDPKDDSIERIAVNEAMNVTGTLLGKDGKIYGQPGTIGKMLIFDPISKSITFKTIPSSSVGNSFQGGAVIGDQLYMVNRLGGKVLVYSLTTESFFEIDVTPNYIAGGVNFVGASLTKDGRIFGTPANQTSVLVIDPPANTARIDVIQNVAVSPTIRNFEGATIGVFGDIFMFPRLSNGVLKINPEGNSFNLLDSISPSLSTFGGGKYITGELIPSGKILSPPYVGNTTNLLVTNTLSSQITFANQIVPDFTASNPSYIGSVLAPNGKLYFFSLNGSPILVVDIGETFCDSVLLSTYLNNN